MGLPEIASEAVSVAREARRRLLAITIIAISGLAACGFLTAAVFLALSPEVGALATCLLLGAFYFAITLAGAVLARSGRSQTAKTSAKPKPSLSDQDAIAHLVSTFMAGVRAARDS